jgi:competence protein ComEC
MLWIKMNRIFTAALFFFFGCCVAVTFPGHSLGAWFFCGALLVYALLRKKQGFGLSWVIFFALLSAGYLRLDQARRASFYSLSKGNFSTECTFQVVEQSTSFLLLQALEHENRTVSFRAVAQGSYDPEIEGKVVTGKIIEIQQYFDGFHWRQRAKVDGIVPNERSLGFINKIRAEILRCRLYLYSKVDVLFSGLPNVSHFMKSALLQSRKQDGKELRDNLSVFGLRAVFSVSGFHMSILGILAGGILWLLPLPGWMRFSLFSLILFLYGLVAGYSASVIRAFSFAVLMMSARQLKRPGDADRLLGFVLLFHCCLFPLDVIRVGFQLTYGVTWLLLCIARVIAPVQSVSKKMVISTVLFQLGVTPYLLWKFGSVALFSVFGFPLGGVVSILLGAGMILMLMSLLFPLMASWLGTVLFFPVEQTFILLNYLMTGSNIPTLALSISDWVFVLCLLLVCGVFYGSLRYLKNSTPVKVHWLESIRIKMDTDSPSLIAEEFKRRCIKRFGPDELESRMDTGLKELRLKSVPLYNFYSYAIVFPMVAKMCSERVLKHVRAMEQEQKDFSHEKKTSMELVLERFRCFYLLWEEGRIQNQEDLSWEGFFQVYFSLREWVNFWKGEPGDLLENREQFFHQLDQILVSIEKWDR